MKIVHKQSIIKIEKSFIWAKLRTIAWKTASQITLRNCSREAWFLAVLYLVRTKNIKQVRDTFLQGFKNKKKQKQKNRTDQYVHTASQYGLGTWKGSLIIEGVLALASQEKGHLTFNMDIISGQCALFLIIKADYNTCLIGHNLAVLVGIQFKLTHV